MIRSELVSIIQPLHDQYMIKIGKKSLKERGYKHFHPSAFGECIRKIAFQYFSEIDKRLKPKDREDATLQRIFNVGHSFHHRMQYDFAKMRILRGYWRCLICGKVKGREEKLGIFLPEKCECQKEEDKRKYLDVFTYEEIFVKNDEYNFQGHCDGVIEIDKGDPEHRYVVDFKTCNGDLFKILREPDHKYIVQISIYMWLLGIEKGIIYYEDKNRQGVKEFLVKYDEKLIEEIKNNSKSLLNMIKNNKIPRIPSKFTKDRKPCRYCEFRKICWEMSKKRRK